MEITITTPALLFPAVTFLLVAYTNRFLALGSRIRNLHDRYHDQPNDILLAQITSLRRRVILIRNMQACGVGGLFLCVFCILVLFAGWNQLGQMIFVASLCLFLASLAISLREIFLSMEALNLELRSMEEQSQKEKGKRKN
ncbi:MAG: DUF2721 domain-containing protein [Proteobacteria bacterium]|nr:DUF2721 domain-containing protein [Pseudomonadota bacterium]MBU1139530.1 DUF2721 domain-containing protein [Pseudomonadota bacterium]MBU1232815.1 DUF2721 domain-containing protein [Pseudomonadota bacterium]MBU1420191.1 DUF2721 domain-containing protein [Pseudomonadota bacterium]MBU1455520.1 DUF2721 domain-containing protein [Pseudomonadota bacterium]